MLCVHLGPGRLGLGLVVDQLDQVGFSVCLVGRPDVAPEESERQQFGLASADPEVGLEYREVAWSSNAGSVAELPAAVLDLLSARDPVLITCSLGDSIAERVEFIAELLDRRADGAETVLLACENDPDRGYEQIERLCGDALSVCPCVVDRICATPMAHSIDQLGRDRLTPRPRDDAGRRVVAIHPVGEWVVSAPGIEAATLTRLSGAPLVRLVDGPIDAYKARKRWLVGGVHLVLALVARRESADFLPLDRLHEIAFVELAGPLMSQMSSALGSAWPDVPLDRDYAEQRIRAFTETPDTTARVIGGRLIRSDLRPLLKRVNVRIGDAARAAREAGEDCEPFYDAMSLLVSVLADHTRYYDEGAPELDPIVDKEALEIFRSVLADWLDHRRASDLLETLERALRVHYAVFSDAQA
jgi:hypothetical protein